MVAASPIASVDSGPTIDTSHWPLVVVRFGKEAMTAAQVEAFIASLTSLLRRREKHLVVLDGLAVEAGLDARQRRRFTQFVQDAEMRSLSRYKMADVVLLRSPIIRGMLTAVFWLAPPACLTKPFEGIDEALPFIKQRFQEEGVPFTAALESRLLQLRR